MKAFPINLMLLFFLLTNHVLALEGTALYQDAEIHKAGPLVKVDMATGKKTVIAQNVDSPTFSPDGKRIAFMRRAQVYIINNDGGNQEGPLAEVNWNIGVLRWGLNNKIYWVDGKAEVHCLNLITEVDSLMAKFSVGSYGGDLSIDGKRAAMTTRIDGRTAVYVMDMTTGKEWNLAPGKWEGMCMGTISPNGQYVNIDEMGHTQAHIMNWDGTEYKTYYPPDVPGGDPHTEFHGQRFSSVSNDHILYTLQRHEPMQAWVHNIYTDEQHFISNGYARDFWPGPLPNPDGTTDPRMQLSTSSLDFEAKVGGTNPTSQKVNVLNVGDGVLGQVTVQDNVGWLTVTVSGSGNSQVLTNHVNTSGMMAGTYAAVVTVSVKGASNSSETYVVNLELQAVVGVTPSSASWTTDSARQNHFIAFNVLGRSMVEHHAHGKAFAIRIRKIGTRVIYSK